MTREDLKNYYYNQKWIDEQIELYKEQKARAESIKSMNYDGMPKPNNKSNYAIEELIDKYNEILEIMKEGQEKQNQIIKQLERMENSTFRLILFYKYINSKGYEEIATILNYDYYEICKKHGYALNEFDKLDNVHKKTQDITNL